MGTNNKQINFIYHLPYFEHKELCRNLDLDDKWEELAGIYMKFDMMTIRELRRANRWGGSPTEELLSKWGQKNHTIAELFGMLSSMQHYKAMMILKPFVDPQFHHFIYEGEQNLSRYFSLNKAQSTTTSKNENTSRPGNSADANLTPNAPAQNSNLLTNKDLNVDSCNLNVNSPPAQTLPNKRVLPSSSINADSQQKILNTPVAQQISNEQNNTLPLPLPQGFSHYQLENKENNVPDSNPQRKMSNASDVSSVAESCGTIPDIAYKELVVATNGWDRHTILGKGGFGTVFRGNWKNTQVAIKRIEQRGAESSESYQAQLEQSMRELRVLNTCRHDNILPLYGFSIGGDEPCLVYQYMPNGSVEDRLLCRNGTPPLTWIQRHNIAEGTARGLQFLHNNKKPFIHGDIKSANILLDTNYEPRIGDFGLAREGPQNHYTHMKVSRVHGTRPYLPDEFLRSKQISTKVDTYSFGIVLFELATGQRPYDESRPESEKFLKVYIEKSNEQQLTTLYDKKPGPCNQQIYLDLISLGKLCVHHLPKRRPEMEEVLKHLEVMASRRRLASHAQNMVRQNSFTPSNPYDLQLQYDVSQQRRAHAHTPSPTGSPLPFVAQESVNVGVMAANYPYSPMMYQHQQPALAFNNPHHSPYELNLVQQHSPQLMDDPERQYGNKAFNTRGASPFLWAVNGNFVPEKQHTGNAPISVPPAIAVTPPSNADHPVALLPATISNSSKVEDEHANSAAMEAEQPEDCALGLPLISLLGIKDVEDNKTSNTDSETSSAVGKTSLLDQREDSQELAQANIKPNNSNISSSSNSSSSIGISSAIGKTSLLADL